jgi:hypothetical protein
MEGDAVGVLRIMHFLMFNASKTFVSYLEKEGLNMEI